MGRLLCELPLRPRSAVPTKPTLLLSEPRRVRMPAYIPRPTLLPFQRPIPVHCRAHVLMIGSRPRLVLLQRPMSVSPPVQLRMTRSQLAMVPRCQPTICPRVARLLHPLIPGPMHTQWPAPGHSRRYAQVARGAGLESYALSLVSVHECAIPIGRQQSVARLLPHITPSTICAGKITSSASHRASSTAVVRPWNAPPNRLPDTSPLAFDASTGKLSHI